MKKVFTLLLLLTGSASTAFSSCPGGMTEIIIQIIPDAYPLETSWDLTDSSGTMIANGTTSGDTICIPQNSCAFFTIHDAYGDGIFAPGGYWLYADGLLVAQGSNFGSMAQHAVGCPPGSYCSQGIPLAFGTYSAVYDNTWYTYTASLTGMYRFTTCGMNTCDTKIWIYESCNGILNDESPAGTYSFNDNYNCGLQAELNVMLVDSQTYYIRIGDNLDDCSGPVNFEFSYTGPVTGCMDINACNYNPLAQVDDGSCAYYPSPLCSGPDLEFDSIAFVSSLSLNTHTAAQCDVDEGCVTGYGLRYVLSFTSKINNIGTTDYYIGNPTSNPTMFNSNNCHGHTHYEGYGDYRMYDTNGVAIPAGHKNGFCVMDLCGFGHFTCSIMGISSGCYDQYGAGTQCQWLDITDVPEGDYRVAIIVNSNHLPDALGHSEINYANNALQVCVHISRDTAGVPSYTILPNCTPYVDCAGIPGGLAMEDCNHVCNGSSVFGDVLTDAVLDSLDLQEYMNLFTGFSGSQWTSCNDLNGDSALSVYDAALASWCLYNGNASHPGGSPHNHCSFPRNITNPNDLTRLSISGYDLSAGYIDISLLNPSKDIQAYQFSVAGITIQSVVSMTTPSGIPFYLGFNPYSNTIFGLAERDTFIARSSVPQQICRIYFSAVTDTQICISQVEEIINRDGERTNSGLNGPCVQTFSTGLPMVPSPMHLSLYPNPAESTLYLFADARPGMDAEWLIADAAGRLVIPPGKIKVNTWTAVDVSGLSGGVYIVFVRDNAGNTVHARFTRF